MSTYDSSRTGVSGFYSFGIVLVMTRGGRDTSSRKPHAGRMIARILLVKLSTKRTDTMLHSKQLGLMGATPIRSMSE